MKTKSMGFIGGGRVVRIMLQAMKRKNQFPEKIVIHDPVTAAITALERAYPDANIINGSIDDTAAQDWVFLAVHPPVMKEVLQDIQSILKPDSIIISLAPKFKASMISDSIGGHTKIVRFIPNAASFINKGYNPVFFSNKINDDEKKELETFFTLLGNCPQVEEEKLEAYAMIVAMGPTYFWFQLNELYKLARSFGMDEEETIDGIKAMIDGSVKTLFDSGLSYEETVDLIPVKPIGEHEEEIKNIYQTQLEGLYQKIK